MSCCLAPANPSTSSATAIEALDLSPLECVTLSMTQASRGMFRFRFRQARPLGRPMRCSMLLGVGHRAGSPLSLSGAYSPIEGGGILIVSRPVGAQLGIARRGNNPASPSRICTRPSSTGTPWIPPGLLNEWLTRLLDH